ncbi:MAG: DUF805 domain-containing protein, partial [Schleiferiaceae bacterium]|nr:DUF805 domain-containing protein [Schleiferiaceae bacterium]
YYLKVLRQYVDFKGRARRAEYWNFVLISFLISIALSLIDVFAFGINPMAGESGLLSNLYSLAIILPSLGVTVRRLHDVGKSGWFILIALIPIIGLIWLLILFFTDSKPDENKWGPSPKAV